MAEELNPIVEQEYGAEQIQVLEGLEAVRVRPGMYIGSTSSSGLHHLVYTPFQFSDMGGVLQMGETTIVGAYPIIMAEMNMPIERFSDSIYYMSIGFTKMFGYIGIGGAFIYTAYPENRKRVASTIIPLVITASLASITEPIDFMFIFAAPLLYFLHAVIAGAFMALLKILDVTALWNANLLTSVITNIANADKTHRMPLMFVLGALQILVYFVVFSFLIKKLDLKTPGREDDDADSEMKIELANNDYTAMAKVILEGLGGKDNIAELDHCITRLRLEVKDNLKVDEKKIKSSGIAGIIRPSKTAVQVIVGPKVQFVFDELKKMI